MGKNDRLDIDRIAFFGRTYDEYLRMFDLSEALLRKGPVLDCPAGASSFAIEARELGFTITACDILYNAGRDDLLRKGREDIRHVFESFDKVSHLYTWKYYRNKDEVIALRNRALELFAEEFTEGFRKGYYVHARLPQLPFPDKSFALVLSGNFLFLYGDRLDMDFHISCIRELLRVCSGEVRIFPLVGLDAQPYPHLDKMLSLLNSTDIEATLITVPFEFQRGANMMMKLYRKTQRQEDSL
jgi:hypothetical protein